MLKRSARSLHADSGSEMDRGTEVFGEEPFRPHGDDGLGSRVEPGAGANGNGANGIGRVYRYGHSYRAAKEETKAGFVGSNLLGRASRGAPDGLDQTGDCVPIARHAGRKGGETRHRAERREVLLGGSHAEENREGNLALRIFT